MRLHVHHGTQPIAGNRSRRHNRDRHPRPPGRDHHQHGCVPALATAAPRRDDDGQLVDVPRGPGPLDRPTDDGAGPAGTHRSVPLIARCELADITTRHFHKGNGVAATGGQGKAEITTRRAAKTRRYYGRCCHIAASWRCSYHEAQLPVHS